MVLVLVLAREVVDRRIIGGFLTVFITFVLLKVVVFGHLSRLLVVITTTVLLVVRGRVMTQHVLVVFGRAGGVGVIGVGALLNDEVAARVFNDLLPFCTNFLILNLWGALLNRLHKAVLLAAMSQLERLLNDEIAVVVRNEGEEARCFADLADKN